jgi:hypothetical protein
MSEDLVVTLSTIPRLSALWKQIPDNGTTVVSTAVAAGMGQA